MWIVRWIVLLVIIIAVLGFSLQNQSEVVTVHLLGWETGEVPLYIALFISFGIGMASFLLIAVFQQLQTIGDLAKERKQRKKLEQQLEQTKTQLEILQNQLEDGQVNKDLMEVEESVPIREEMLDIITGEEAEKAPAKSRTSAKKKTTKPRKKS